MLRATVVALAMTSRCRGASSRPSYATPLSRHSLTRHHCTDPVVHADATCPNAGGSAAQAKLLHGCPGQARAWRTGKKKIRRRNADRRKALVPRRRRARPRLSAERRTSIGVPPRFSSQGVFHRKGRSLGPGFLGRGGGRVLRVPLSGITRPCLSQSSDSTSRSGRSAGELMPKTARVRVASPPAGTALARAAWDCLPSRVREGRGSMQHVTISVTSVN
jgi:hypothetical protein